MNELSLEILEGHILVADQVKIYNKQMTLHCYYISYVAGCKLKAGRAVVDDKELLKGSQPAK